MNKGLTMYPVTGASGGAILSPWLRMPAQLESREPCHSSILLPVASSKRSFSEPLIHSKMFSTFSLYEE